MIRLYNSKTLQIEEFKEIQKGHVNMYVCGPTVYNYAHIGNARPMIVFDVLKRLLQAVGYTVTYASNFTDVDDKIINKAKQEGISEKEVAQRYILAYQELRTLLNTQQPDITPRVTETMEEIIAFIDDLVQHGYAYEVNGDVYFAVEHVDTYGEISHQILDQLEVGARIEENTQKKNPFDFALWKKTEEGIQWDSPWGKGRPGWHTECVVMINNHLGEMIDIHGGGMDLKFPHHENEVAQQEACHHNTLANYWIHNAMVNIDGEKMSKSLGNTLWAKDVVGKLGTPLTRWLVSSVHYRKELNFSEETINAAKKELDKVTAALKQADLRFARQQVVLNNDYDVESYQAFIEQMADDMNTPNAYAVIFDTVKKLNQSLRQKEIDLKQVQRYRNAIVKMLDILGIPWEMIQLSSQQRELFELWDAAKQAKDFEKADTYRQQLIQQGVL